LIDNPHDPLAHRGGPFDQTPCSNEIPQEMPECAAALLESFLSGMGAA
jgi:hypothetical protein